MADTLYKTAELGIRVYFRPLKAPMYEVPLPEHVRDVDISDETGALNIKDAHGLSYEIQRGAYLVSIEGSKPSAAVGSFGKRLRDAIPGKSEDVRR